MKLFLFYLLLNFYSTRAYKILVYSAPLGYSHTTFMGRIADILQEAGHDVTVLHPLWEPEHVAAVSNSAKKMLFSLPRELSSELQPRRLRVWDISSKSITDQLRLLSAHTNLQIRACELLLADNHTMQTLMREHFDAGITEMLGTCGFGIFNKIGVGHMIATSALGTLDSIGELFDVPKLPSIAPSFLLPYSDRMNFFERTTNFVVSIIADLVSLGITLKYKEVWSRYGVSVDDDDYMSKMNYLLSNSDEFLEFARPTTPKIVHIGGVVLQEPVPLQPDLQRIMNQSRKGVVYISFGSITPTLEMPSRIRTAILEVAKENAEIDFIWKVDEGDKIAGSPNLHTFKWVPQQTLLMHTNLVCFVSHAGLNSVLELTRGGKASILVPIFGDQFRNARLVEAKNTTIVIAKEDFNRDTFAAALRQILTDNGFALRAQRLASLMTNKPFSVKERLLSTIEFSIRYGKIHNLDTYARHLNALQYHSVDVVAFLTVVSLVLVIASFYSFRHCCRNILEIKMKSE